MLLLTAATAVPQTDTRTFLLTRHNRTTSGVGKNGPGKKGPTMVIFVYR